MSAKDKETKDKGDKTELPSASLLEGGSREEQSRWLWEEQDCAWGESWC